jgi:hypothetical protein
MIGTVEAALIKWKTPLWKSFLDGFGNHDPGKGRYQQSKSDWDVVHPGRPWAENAKANPQKRRSLLSELKHSWQN